MDNRSSYSELNAQCVLRTLDALHQRIEERLPGSGILGLCGELRRISSTIQAQLEWIRAPIWPLRISTALVLLLMGGLIAATISNVEVHDDTFNLTNFVDVVQNVIQDLVYLAIAVFFLVRIEAMIKRRRVLRALHQLRSIAHVIDMHQLTKDPDRLAASRNDTVSSPKLTLTPFLLRRYLDYCSEMLSLTGKIAALHLRDFDDSAIVAAVTEIEDLTTGLSRKIWQKITGLRNA